MWTVPNGVIGLPFFNRLHDNKISKNIIEEFIHLMHNDVEAITSKTGYEVSNRNKYALPWIYRNVQMVYHWLINEEANIIRETIEKDHYRHIYKYYNNNEDFHPSQYPLAYMNDFKLANYEKTTLKQFLSCYFREFDTLCNNEHDSCVEYKELTTFVKENLC